MSGYEDSTPEAEMANPKDSVDGDPIKADPDEAPELRDGGILNNGQTRENLRLS